MKQITVTLDDDVYEAAEREAAKCRTDVTSLIEGYLRTLPQQSAMILPEWSEQEEKKNREELVAALKQCNLVLGYKPSRDKTYER